MDTKRFQLAVSAAMLTIVFGCTQAPRSQPRPDQKVGMAPSAVDRPATLIHQPTSFDTLGTYKYHAAHQIMRDNANHTFSGKLPPMLPAIVVLEITVDNAGKVTEVTVQRSPNKHSANVAIAAMARVRHLPPPHNLANGLGRTLTFSETFLFNSDERFQLRTLAPIQSGN